MWLSGLYIYNVSSQTFTGKTGIGTASLGATRLVTDVEIRVTSITSNKVRQGISVGNSTKIGFAGSYGLVFTGAGNDLIVRWRALSWTKEDYDEPSTVAATSVFWALRPGVTATLVVTY